MAQVTSFVSDRGRAIGVVAALTASVALASAPAAFGAVDGDPIASSVFNVNFSSGQLKQNGVKLKPKKLKLVAGDVDPTTGAGDLTLGKVTFKKGNKKVVYNNLKGSLPGTLKGSSGNLFKLSGGTAARLGFGASITGVKVKFLKSATKKLNRKLGLHSLHPGIAGTLSLSYQPQTVKVLSGTAKVLAILSGGSAGIKFLAGHCVNGLIPNGITTIAPATSNGGVPPTFTFPVVGGTVSPVGTEGVINMTGGLRNNKNVFATPCDNGFSGTLDLTDLAVNLGEKNIQSHTVIVAAPPSVFPGDKGVAIGQKLVTTNLVVNANPVAHTITVSGAEIQLNSTSSTVLNGVFPNTSGIPANDFADGDPFGTATLTVTTR